MSGKTLDVTIKLPRRLRVKATLPMRCASKREGNRVARFKRSPGYAPTEYRAKQDHFRWLLRQQVRPMPKLIEGYAMVVLKLYFKDKRHPDEDNAKGFVYDCLNGFVWRDDRWVLGSHVEMVLNAGEDKIELEVWEWEMDS